MLLQEIVTKWSQDCHVMALFKDTVEPKPNDFLSKFVNNNDSQQLNKCQNFFSIFNSSIDFTIKINFIYLEMVK